MAHRDSIQRLLREYEKLQKLDSKQFICEPNPQNLFEWHFVVYNLSDYYQGGQYHGILSMPPEYPLKPPTLKFFTPSGRFMTGTPICLQNVMQLRSFTNFHPESWSSAQTIESMMVSLISFMFTNENTTGGMITSASEKQLHARKSINFNLQNQQFVKIFKKHFNRLGLDETISQPNIVIEEQESQITITQFLIGGVLTLLVIYFLLQSIVD